MISERTLLTQSFWTNRRLWISVAVGIVLLPVVFLEDGQIHSFLMSLRIRSVYAFMRYVTKMGGGWALAMEAAVLFGIGWWWQNLKLKKAGLRSLIALGVSGVFVQVIKHLIGRPRPRLGEQGIVSWGVTFEKGHDSFPSGHAISAFAMAAVLSSFYPAHRWAWYSIAALIGFSRVYLGAHYASDVIFGALLGIGVGVWASRTKLEYLRS